eukprot:m.320182 g.320182  ORF g.320182 m.320182 type:complete len:101 (+) comp20317_c0_seq6:493-795(+)
MDEGVHTLQVAAVMTMSTVPAVSVCEEPLPCLRAVPRLTAFGRLHSMRSERVGPAMSTTPSPNLVHGVVICSDRGIGRGAFCGRQKDPLGTMSPVQAGKR